MSWLQTVSAWRRGRGGVAGPAGVQAPLLDEADLRELARRAVLVAAGAAGRREADYPQHGEVHARRLGAGLDYEESRPFQPGDEPRFINWRLLARTGEHYVKVFREERRPGVFLLVDRRAGMRFGTRRRLKVTQAARAAALIAFAAARAQTGLGGVMLEARPRWLRGLMGEAGAYTLARAATAPCLPPQHLPGAGHAAAPPALAAPLEVLRASLPRGTRIYLISDFADLDATLVPTLLALSDAHAVQALHIVDAAEQALPAVGPLWLAPAAGQAARYVNTDDAALRADYAQAAEACLAGRESLLRAAGIPCRRLAAETEAIEREVPLP
ncbi:MAG TPA: DUF58 domain-containing protein [Thioalkalivibrio sp.]|nr:DUF58 domain-containing protein [Thioalkalivibrio sp.]